MELESTGEGAMKGNTVNRPTEKGQARWVIIVAVLVFVPLAFSVALHISPDSTESSVSSESFLEMPDPQYEDCVRETYYMRHQHWVLLRSVREEVVRYGKRGDIGLSKCSECHTSRERFCDRCHEAASLTPDCFGCHYYP